MPVCRSRRFMEYTQIHLLMSNLSLPCLLIYLIFKFTYLSYWFSWASFFYLLPTRTSGYDFEVKIVGLEICDKKIYPSLSTLLIPTKVNCQWFTTHLMVSLEITCYIELKGFFSQSPSLVYIYHPFTSNPPPPHSATHCIDCLSITFQEPSSRLHLSAECPPT